MHKDYVRSQLLIRRQLRLTKEEKEKKEGTKRRKSLGEMVHHKYASGLSLVLAIVMAMSYTR